MKRDPARAKVALERIKGVVGEMSKHCGRMPKIPSGVLLDWTLGISNQVWVIENHFPITRPRSLPFKLRGFRKHRGV